MFFYYFTISTIFLNFFSFIPFYFFTMNFHALRYVATLCEYS